MIWIRRFRRLVNIIADAAFIIKAPADLQRVAVILHGDSCSGKSTILQRLRRRYTGCTYMEADDLQYWRIKPDPDILNIAHNLLVLARVDDAKARKLVQTIEKFAELPGMTYSPYSVMVELIKTCLANDVVISTCGNLPPPHGEFGYYQLLAECSGKVISHVLVAPDSAEYAKRVRSRRRAAVADKLIKDYGWRQQHRAFYDLVVTGNEPTARIMELLQGSARMKKNEPIRPSLEIDSSEVVSRLSSG